MSKDLLTKEEPRDNWMSAAQLLTQTWSMSVLVPEEGRKRWKRKPKMTTGMAAIVRQRKRTMPDRTERGSCAGEPAQWIGCFLLSLMT